MDNNIDEVLSELGIGKRGVWSKSGAYIIDIASSDEFGKIQSILEKNEDLEELGDTSTITMDTVNISYLYGDYELTLSADFNADDYQLIIVEFEYTDDDEDEEFIFDEEEEE